MNNDLPKCTVCGEQATAIIRNFMREETENGGYKLSGIGKPEWRCKNHDEPTMYNTGSLYDIAVFKFNSIIENEKTV